MAVAPVKRLNTQDAIELVWERVISGEYASVGECVRALWADLAFEPMAYEMLAMEGLIWLSKRENHELKRHISRPANWGAPHGKKWDRYLALTFPYEGADGRQRPLLEFTISDLAAFAVRMEKMSQAFEQRRAWASATEALLIEHGVARVGDLPPLVLKQVNADAAEVIGRQD